MNNIKNKRSLIELLWAQYVFEERSELEIKDILLTKKFNLKSRKTSNRFQHYYVSGEMFINALISHIEEDIVRENISNLLKSTSTKYLGVSLTLDHLKYKYDYILKSKQKYIHDGMIKLEKGG